MDFLSNSLAKFWQSLAVKPLKVLVAVSGGADSLALLHSLWTANLSIAIEVAHLDHQIRGEAAQEDARFVAYFCEQRNIKCHLEGFDVKAFAQVAHLSLEDAARRVRYAFLINTALQNDCTLILTAHNADDQAETVLMRLLRSTGTHGLAAMSPVSPLPPIDPLLKSYFPLESINLRLGRPFLEVWRRDIDLYCQANQLMPRHDETNLQSDYQRNRIRHDLLPLLEKTYNPHIKMSLVRLAQISRLEQNWLDSLVALEFEKLAKVEPNIRVVFDQTVFATQHPALQNRLIRQAILRLKSLQNIDAAHVEAVRNLFLGDKEIRLSLPHNLTAVRKPTTVSIEIITPVLALLEPLILPIPGVLYDPLGNWKLEASLVDNNKLDFSQLNKYSAYLDYAKTGDNLMVRSRQVGERFQPLGAPGRRKLQDVLVDAHVPREKRDGWPIVVKDANICWVVGVAIGHDFRVTVDTQKIVKLDFSWNISIQPEQS